MKSMPTFCHGLSETLWLGSGLLAKTLFPWYRLTLLDIIIYVAVECRPVDGISHSLIALRKALVALTNIHKVGVSQGLLNNDVMTFQQDALMGWALIICPSIANPIMACVGRNLASYGALCEKCWQRLGNWQFLFWVWLGVSHCRWCGLPWYQGLQVTVPHG